MKAVVLGLRASDLLETDIEERHTQDEACEAGDKAGEPVEAARLERRRDGGATYS